jgi:uncharacterized membrane protein YsdA (DUF1294 family)
VKPWHLYVLLSALPWLLLLWQFGMPAWTWFAIVNCLAVALYAQDKTNAQHGKFRIAELALHALALAGGGAGAAWAREKFRHKTLKPVFDAVLLLASVPTWLVLLHG